MKKLLKEISACTICAQELVNGVNPVMSATKQSKIVIIGQAPGTKVHKSSIPWDDKSGDKLREWMAIEKEDFYDPKKIAIVPMGFCYPGKGKSGDLPPRKECAPKWHPLLWEKMKEVQLTILIGQYAQSYYLPKRNKMLLTETVKNFKDYLPKYFVLPHPSPRNNIWFAKNQWFEKSVLPQFRSMIQDIIS